MILVLGLGNILLRDEGLGVVAAENLLSGYNLPRSVQVMDGGVMGLDLLPYLQEADALLVLDAVQTDQPPGTLVRLEGEAIPSALALKMSMHQVGLQELLALSSFQGSLPARVVLWGMEPSDLHTGIGLSPVITAGLPQLVTAVVRELREWGVEVIPTVDSSRDTTFFG